MGVTIRHYFNSMHARKGEPTWTWLATAVLFIVIMWLSTAPLRQDGYEESEARDLTTTEQHFASAEGFDDVMSIVPGRCAMCHSREPYWDGIHYAPKGVLLETPADVAQNARLIYIQSGVTHAMPPANVSWMEDDERKEVVRWYQGAVDDMPLTLARH